MFLGPKNSLLVQMPICAESCQQIWFVDSSSEYLDFYIFHIFIDFLNFEFNTSFLRTRRFEEDVLKFKQMLIFYENNSSRVPINLVYRTLNKKQEEGVPAVCICHT